MTLRKPNTDKNNGSPDYYDYPDLIGIPVDIISNECGSAPLFHFDDPLNLADYKKIDNLSFRKRESDPFDFNGYFV
ncbi:MAG: hypothetical protein H7196_05020 [candidate division SR1 bacterium]|nr:hypothetical protein [candidate division SR1 bacterium]